MRHHSTGYDSHWAVGFTGTVYIPGMKSQVLVQVMEKGVQARIPLTPEQATAMAEELLLFAGKARDASNAGASE